MTVYEVLTLLFDFGIFVFVGLEYLYGRPDIVKKNEAKRERKVKESKIDSYEKEMD